MRARRWTRKLALLGAATLASLLAGELVVRLCLDVSVAPFLRDWDPDAGLRYKRNLSATITGPEFDVRFSTNSRGFREPEPPPSLEGCVLFLGDSYTEGWGVNDGEDYPSVVRRELDDRYGAGVVPVVNAAMSATGQSRWLQLLRSDLREATPRLVVFQVCWNDCVDNISERQFRVIGVRPMPTALGTRTELLQRVSRTEPLTRRIQPLLELIPGLQGSHLFALARQIITTGGPGQSKWQLDADEPDAEGRRKVSFALTGRNETVLFQADVLFLALVEHSLAICRARGWPTAVISVRIGGPRLRELEKLCARFDTTLLDIRNRVDRPELYIPVDSHWNAAGHRFVADLVLERLGEHLKP